MKSFKIINEEKNTIFLKMLQKENLSKINPNIF